jgi:hypothetical protein
MVREANVAVFAHGSPTASLAFQHRRVPAAVLKQDGLFAIGTGSLERFNQRRRKQAVHLPCFQLFAQIDHFDSRHLHTTKALFKFYQTVFTRLGVVIAFYGRRGGTQ